MPTFELNQAGVMSPYQVWIQGIFQKIDVVSTFGFSKCGCAGDPEGENVSLWFYNDAGWSNCCHNIQKIIFSLSVEILALGLWRF